MSTGLSWQSTSGDALQAVRMSTISTETNLIIGCPICASYPDVNIPKNPSQNLRFSERKCPACGNYCGKPALLDLFSGAGGAARGYQKAGFCVLGVDIKPQPHYAGCRFVQADALTFPLEGYDAYHASPPCQANTFLKPDMLHHRTYGHKDLIPETRAILAKTGKPYIIENVVGATMNTVIILCGTMFGLKVFRHRLFESNIMLLQPSHIKHKGKTRKGYPANKEYEYWCITGSVGEREGAQQAMGIDWMARKASEVSQAIPPAYTEYIGKFLIEAIMKQPTPGERIWL